MKLITLSILLLFLVSCWYFQRWESPETTHISEILNWERTDSIMENLGELWDNPETQRPHTSLDPAFQWQTRVSWIETQTDIQIQEIVDFWEVVWSIAQLPSEKLLVTLRSGTFSLLTPEGDTLHDWIETWLNLSASRQGWLLDIVPAPDYEATWNIFFTFSEVHENWTVASVWKGIFDEELWSLSESEVIFRATPSYNWNLHYWSRLAFDSDGNLFASFWERSDMAIRDSAQDDSTFLWSIVYITQDGSPASSDWYWFALPELYSIWHRNPQWLVYDIETSRLWSSEMWPRWWDEINLIWDGKNYGWPVVTYGEEYSWFAVWDGISQQEGMEQPRYYWDPAVSPSWIDIYRGDIEEWNDNLIIGNLSWQIVIRLVIDWDTIVAEEWLFSEMWERFRDVHSGHDGNLYLATDSGKIFSVSPR